MTESAISKRSFLRDRIAPVVEKILYRLGIRTPPKLDSAVADFVAVNSGFWAGARTGADGRILIEGHLAEYGPNYLMRTAVAAKALQELSPAEIDVVFNGLANRWRIATRVYKSFGIGNFIFLGRFVVQNAWYFLASVAAAARIVRGLRTPQDILGIRYGNLKVGDLIYDDVLKKCGVKTVVQIDRKVRQRIRKSYYYYLQYSALFRRRRYRCYVATHTTYSEYGILCRVALGNGVPVLETTDIQMAYHDDITDERLPTYHDGIRRTLLKSLERPEFSVEIMAPKAEQALRKRLNSEIRQLDTDKAFRGRTYSRADLCQALNVPAHSKIVFILAHVFADSPHLSSGMLYSDYFQWLLATLKISATIPNVTWIVKPHPASEYYGETGTTERMIAELHTDNVYLCPRDLNTRSLEQCADALITVHGTAGLEFACVGIPIVLAGKPFFSRLGYTRDPETREEYERELRQVDKIARLTELQRQRALQIFGVWEQMFEWQNPIITSDVLASVWGDERPRDLRAAYEILARNLRHADPRRTRLWSFAQSVVSGA